MIDLNLQITLLTLANKQNNSVYEITEFGKLNLKECQKIARSKNSVLVNKVNKVQSYTLNPIHLTPTTST